VEFTVDEQRFQIRDSGVREWQDTKIVDITKRYFGVLPYTPLRVVGINFNSTIAFQTPQEGVKCEELCLPQGSKLAKILSNAEVSASIRVRYGYGGGNGTVTLTIEAPAKDATSRAINLNYEFGFSDWKSFEKELSGVPDVARYCDNILNGIVETL
jgi:hypothetical protein